MVTKTEGAHTGAHLVSEGNGTVSREEITIVSGAGVLEAGTVLGKITKGAATPAAVAGNTGNGTIAAATVGAGAKVGVYRAVCVEPAANAGKFSVEDPDGITVGVATVAVEFTGGGLTFTIADGATDFVSGDSFTITVADGSLKFKPYDTDNTDGSEVAAGILYDGVDATSADQPGIAHVRMCEVNGSELTGLDAGATADLAALGVIVR